MKRIKKVERDAPWFLISKLAHYQVAVGRLTKNKQRETTNINKQQTKTKDIQGAFTTTNDKQQTMTNEKQRKK